MTFADKRDSQAADQQRVNEMHLDGQNAEAVATEIRRLANTEHAGFSQYVGYWDKPEWLLGRAAVKVAGKGGTMVEPGDIVLMQQYASEIMIFSVRLGWNCVILHGVNPLCGWEDAHHIWRDVETERRAVVRSEYVANIMARLA